MLALASSGPRPAILLPGRATNILNPFAGTVCPCEVGQDLLYHHPWAISWRAVELAPQGLVSATLLLPERQAGDAKETAEEKAKACYNFNGKKMRWYSCELYGDLIKTTTNLFSRPACPGDL